MKKITNKKFDNIFTGIIFIFIIGFGFYIGGASGVIDAIIVFIQETFKVFICFTILIILCIFFPKIRNLFNKSNKN